MAQTIITIDDEGAAQYRATFTSSEVGNGSPNDSGTLPNQDGGLAVRIQEEDTSGNLTGDVERFSDEGVTLFAPQGAFLDVRDLPTGVARGDRFSAVVLGTSSADVLTAAAAPALNWYFNAGGGNDRVTGGTGADFLVGGGGDDTLDGGAGDDSFIGGGGNDRIVGGTGTDIVIYGGTTAGVTVSLATNAAQDTGGAGVDTISGVENLTGSGFGDALSGNSAANVINGAAGDDRIDGRAGNDRIDGGEGADFLRGGSGNDVIDGGAGVDTADFSDATIGLFVDLRVTRAQDTRGAGVDTIRGVENAIGGRFRDELTGNSVANRLEGGDGNDRLDGGGNNDVLIGGQGADNLIGGAGLDRFVTLDASESTAAARDTILDFQSGADVIDVSAAGDFTFVDDFTGAGGELRARKIGEGLFLAEIDADGDEVADWVVEVRGSNLVEGDFFFG